MLLLYLRAGFGLISLLLGVLLSIRIFGDKFFKNNNKLSPFVAFIGGLFFLYILSALVLVIFYPGILRRLVMLFIAISPFIIGKLVSYKKLRLYSIIQILCVILSMVFVILF